MEGLIHFNAKSGCQLQQQIEFAVVKTLQLQLIKTTDNKLIKIDAVQ